MQKVAGMNGLGKAEECESMIWGTEAAREWLTRGCCNAENRNTVDWPT